MVVWRLCKEKFADDLDGKGAFLYGGRWNSPGYSVLYTASSLSLACLEILAGLANRRFPQRFVSLQLQLPDDASSLILSRQDFPRQWRHHKHLSWFQKTGDAWIQSRKTLSLIVPSILIPSENNVLLNPQHPDSYCVKILQKRPFHFDPRLIQ